MKVYRINIETNLYQSVFPNIEESKILEYMTFDCIKKSIDWSKIDWQVFNPKMKKGNFFGLGLSGALIFDENVFKSDLYTLIEMAGQILHIKVDGFNLYALNVLECVNALNRTKTVNDIYEDGTTGRILEYSFNKTQISVSTIFKIPETCKGEILTYVGLKDEDDEFKSLYEKLGFTGLSFTEIG